MALWLKRLLARLNDPGGVAADIVAMATLTHFNLAIRYRTGLRDQWPLATLGRDQATLGQPLHPARQYEPDPLASPAPGRDDYSHHLTIPGTLFARASLLDRALGLQRLVLALLQTGYCGRQHPLVLQADWATLRAAATAPAGSIWDRRCCPTSGHRSGQLRVYPFGCRHPGRALIEHFCDVGDYSQSLPYRITLTEGFRRPRRLLSAIRRLLAAGRAVTTAAVARALHAGPTLYSPMAYLTLFRQLRFAGTVLDLQPALGYKALACAALGAPYQCAPAPSWLPELAAYVGLKDGSRAAPELVIGDACFRRDWAFPAEEPPWYAANGGARPMLCLFLPGERRADPLPRWLGAPTWRLRVAVNPLRRDPDYFLLYRV